MPIAHSVDFKQTGKMKRVREWEVGGEGVTYNVLR